MANGNDPGSVTGNVWNALEICKLLVGLAVPLAIFYGTQVYSKQEETSRLQDVKAQQEKTHDQAKNDEKEKRLVDRRYEIWEKMASPMDRIYSYFLYVGSWKETSPEQIIKDKRELDDLVYSNKIFFSKPFFDNYSRFIQATFETYQGFGVDPKLMTVRVRNLDRFSKVVFSDCDNAREVYDAFWSFQEQSGDELELPHVAPAPRPEMPTKAMTRPCSAKP